MATQTASAMASDAPRVARRQSPLVRGLVLVKLNISPRTYEPRITPILLQISAELVFKMRAVREYRIVNKNPHFCNESLVRLDDGKEVSGENKMSIDKNRIKTQDELEEPAPMDQAEQRVEAEMKKLEGQAKKEVAEGLRQQDEANNE
jgi:hypothetical protein